MKERTKSAIIALIIATIALATAIFAYSTLTNKEEVKPLAYTDGEIPEVPEDGDPCQELFPDEDEIYWEGEAPTE